MAKPLLSPKEAARQLGVHVDTLKSWRKTGKGPKSIKLGGERNSPVRYKPEDLDDFAKSK